MDLVQGVDHIYVITQHTTKTGEPKLVERCSYPLTGTGVVSRIYTNLAVIDVTAEGFQLFEHLLIRFREAGARNSNYTVDVVEVVEAYADGVGVRVLPHPLNAARS